MQGEKTKQKQQSAKGAIRATTRSPLSYAAIGSIASMVLATGANAQDALPQIDVVSNNGSQTYQATNQTITRLPTPLLDTPQTINVVTERVIQETGARTLEEALRTVPGITFQAGEGGQQGDSPVINGFSARGDIYRDGVRDPGWYTRDLFNSDRVEVYKGPSAFAFGRGTTGGAINFVSKLPTGASFVDTVVTGYTQGGVRTELDASGKKDKFSWRFAAMGQDIDTADRDNVWTKRWGAAPSMKYDFTSQTSMTLAYIYQGEESIPDYGHPYLPAPVYSPLTGARTNAGYYGTGQPTGPVPIARNAWFGVFGGPLADVVDNTTHIATAKFEHQFNKDAKITNVTRYVQNDRSARPTAPRSLGTATNNTTIPTLYPVNLMTVGRQHFWNDTNNAMLVNQTDFVGKVYTGPIEHTVVAGMELMKETRWAQRANGMDANNLCAPTTLTCRTSLAYPMDTTYGGTFRYWNAAQDTESTNVAFYGSDQIKLNQYFELLGAIRYDYFSTDFSDPAAVLAVNRNLSRTDGMLSWRVGGVFHPTPNSSLYVATGVSYNPAAELGTLSGAANSTANVRLPPEENKSIEAGAKVDLLQNKLSVTGSVYRIEKSNLRIALDPSLPNADQVLVLDGVAQVDGIEFGVAGALTDKWQIFAGYVHLKSEIKKTRNMAELGRELPNTPTDSFTLWTSYSLTPEWLIGGGAVYNSETYVNVTNTSFVPEYWRFDAMTSYKVHKNHTIQLNVYNLTDERYYAQSYAGHAVPASGRYAALSWRAKWQ